MKVGHLLNIKGPLPFPKLAQQFRGEKKNQTERHLSIYCVAAQTLKDSDEFASSFAFSISSSSMDNEIVQEWMGNNY